MFRERAASHVGEISFDGSACRVARRLLCPAVLAGLASIAALASTGGPDAFGYTFTDSNEVGGPALTFEDIAGTGTPIATFFSTAGAVNNDDGLSAPIPLGFAFEFYGASYTNVFVCSNGFV